MVFAWVRPQQQLDPEIEVFSPASDGAEDDTNEILDDRYELREAIAWGGTAAGRPLRGHFRQDTPKADASDGGNDAEIFHRLVTRRIQRSNSSTRR